ncbi:MAG: aldo/keto reductase [Candidatus Omnitrophica bacterium]|nr:aldo/keto reductase [Candidatus Omnitrophota bacterium]
MAHANPNDNADFRQPEGIRRREFLKYLGVTACAAMSLPFFPRTSFPAPRTILSRRIPRTNEQLPVIGMGTWQTFHVGTDPQQRAARTEVLRTFFKLGGGMVDSSPMYGSAEQVLGHALERIDDTSSLFSATKVWTPFTGLGVNQIMNSHKFWGLDQFDLIQIHNLLNWEKHLETLIEWKNLGLVRYIGITTSHGRRHELMEKLMTSIPIDFVQLTYNIVDREVEQRLLPIAKERELGVIINRPFQGGRLFDRFAKHPLPAFAAGFDCKNWAQFFLKYIVSHPAVTCAIPATSQVGHMRENMGALEGRMPEIGERTLMEEYIKEL